MLVVQDGFGYVLSRITDLIGQENLQDLVRLALDIGWIVVAGEGIAWHEGSLRPDHRQMAIDSMTCIGGVVFY